MAETKTVNLTLSMKAWMNLKALTERLKSNQHDTGTLVFENLDVEKFARSVKT